MSYYFSTVVKDMDFENTISRVTEELKAEGFGIITEIDVTDTFRKKLDISYKKYRILGACNPNFAYKALQAEDKIGVFLPCNVIVEENENGTVEVAAVDPVASMMAVENKSLADHAQEIRNRLMRVINRLKQQ